MMFQMLGVFAEFERAMIKERINAGLARARAQAQGKTLGRPKVSLQVENKIRKLRSTGKGIRKIASELRVGVSTVKRVVDELKVA
jgi:DNA invertase Pin-like site-specific DNA recombinase